MLRSNGCAPCDAASAGASGGVGEVLTHPGEELAWTKRLGNECIAASGASLGFVTAQGIRGDRDNGDRFQIDNGLNSSSGLEAIDSRQLNVHQDKIRLFVLRQPHGIFSVEGLDQIVTRPAQDIAQYRTVVLLVLDDENALCHVGPR